MGKICFLFGYSSAPESISSALLQAIICQYNSGIKEFAVGQRGNFDRIATRTLRAAKELYPDIILHVLLYYHPAERAVDIPKGFDDSLYMDGMENVPRQFAIVEANRRMVKSAHSLLCYVVGPGNSRNLFEYAIRQGKTVCNIAYNVQ